MKFLMVAGLALTIAATRANNGVTCQTVAGASLDYPAAFTVDPPYPAVPTVLDSSQAFSARSEGARLKVSRFFYVQGLSADAAASVGNVLAVWKQLADGGVISSQVEPRTVSGIEGKTAQATFSLRGQSVRGQVFSVGRDRILWEFISVYPDTPAARTLIQQAFASIKVPGSCE